MRELIKVSLAGCASLLVLRVIIALKPSDVKANTPIEEAKIYRADVEQHFVVNGYRQYGMRKNRQDFTYIKHKISDKKARCIVVTGIYDSTTPNISCDWSEFSKAQ